MYYEDLCMLNHYAQKHTVSTSEMLDIISLHVTFLSLLGLSRYLDI